MATHTGDEGLVQIGANTVAEVRSFSLTETTETFDDSSKGDTYRTHKTGKTEWNGTVECWYDETDTTGQVAMTAGANVTLTLLPEGNTTGDDSFSGTATITEYSLSSPEDGIVEASFSFQGNGALTRGTV